jgi:prephenate dehydratase
MKYAVLGPKGTFSDLAYQKYHESVGDEVFYTHSIEATIKSLDQVDYAIVPIENTLDGYVQQTLDILFSESVFIVDEIFIPVQFDFVGNDVDAIGIKRIYSQFVAKGQCSKLLSKFQDVELILTESNMKSYEEVFKGNRYDAAIIPSHIKSNAFKLTISNVADVIYNYTRFVVVKKSEQPFNSFEKFKVSLVVTPDNDRPGLLFDILKIFKDQHINLTSIMSRPKKEKMGQYFFFIDFNSNGKTFQEIKNCLKLIQDVYTIKIIGIYKEGQY